jgi:hypothetical protein
MRIPLKKLKDEWMKDPAFRLEYKRLSHEFVLQRTAIKMQARQV